MAICDSTWNMPETNSPPTNRISPRWTSQRPALLQVAWSRIAWAAMRFTMSTRPTVAPPGKTGIIHWEFGMFHQTTQLRM